MCWETSEEGEMRRSLVLYMIVITGTLLLSTLSEIWGSALPFLVCPSNTLFSFCSVLSIMANWDGRGFCGSFLQVFSNSSLGLCTYGSAPAPVYVENLESVHQRLSNCPLLFCPHVEHRLCSCDRADHISGEEQGCTLVFRVIGREPYS